MSELKPCPFCGGKAARLSDVSAQRDNYGVLCMCCTARIWSYYSQERADEQWNRRADNSNDFTPQKDDFSKEGDNDG